jgi:hypothetical protein
MEAAWRDLLHHYNKSLMDNIYSPDEKPVAWLTEVCHAYLSVEEAEQIHQQFQSERFLPNAQVMWSGMLQETAQKWADDHGMQTLTAAMGPLKMSGHPSCLRSSKSDKKWSKYIKGASVLFAYYITKGKKVTLLTPPPPDRFHPMGGTNYQSIEEPILKGFYGNVAVDRIDIVHPLITLAEDFRYQIWPVDESCYWIEKFSDVIVPLQRWRKVKLQPSSSGDDLLYSVAQTSEGHIADEGRRGVKKQITSEINLQVKLTKVANSIGADSVIESTKNSKQKRTASSDKMAKAKGLAMTATRTERTIKPKQTAKTRVNSNTKKKSNTKQKGIPTEKSKAKKVTIPERVTSSTKLNLETSKALRISFIALQNLCSIVAVEHSLAS